MPATIDREWIAAEFAKGIEAEHNLFLEAKARVADPPDAALGVLYNEIAAADEKHRDAVETVAIRYGYNPPSKGIAGIADTINRLKDKVTAIGTQPLERLGHDLAAKASAVHWYTAWIAAFDAAGEAETVRELTAIVNEEKAHRDALQQALNRLVEAGLQGNHPARD